MSALKAHILPPLIALLLYLTIVFAILPLYRQRQRYTQYIPISLPSNMQPHSLREWLMERIAAYADPLSSRFHRRSYSGLSDEEMVDPLDDLEELQSRGRGGIRGSDGYANAGNDRRREDSERRLSRDLEAGFRDDSDEE